MVLQKIKKFLISPRTSVSLIVVILFSCIMAFLIPQVHEQSASFPEFWNTKDSLYSKIVDQLQLARVFTSVWFLCAIFLTLLSLGYSLSLQVRKNMRYGQMKRRRTIKSIDHQKQLTIACEHDLNIDNVRRILRKRRYREVSSAEKGNLVFIKNVAGIWGSVILHVGILLVICSALMAYFFQIRGYVQLIAGDTFSGKYTDFLSEERGTFATGADMDFKTHLSSLKYQYGEKDVIMVLESSVRLMDKGGKIRHASISIGEPIEHNGMRIYQSGDYGYTLSFILERKDEERLVAHFNLNMTARKDSPLLGKYDFPSTDYIIEIKFYPDVLGRSFHLMKPIAYLTVYDVMTDDVLFEGLLIPSHGIKIKKDILTFAGITEWSGLIYTKNTGMTMAYTGFFLCIAGALIMFGIPYKEIQLAFENTGAGTLLDVYASTGRYRAIFRDEVEGIANDIRDV